MSENPGVSDLLQNTKGVEEVVDKYYEYFDQKKGATKENRNENYGDVVNSYYDLATDFYEYGWGKSFHFATQYKHETLQQAIARHEHYIALKLGLSKGKEVLDCGCGVGGPAREIARFSGCNVTGLNNNAYQVGRANKHTKTEGLEGRCRFVKGDFMNIPAADESFDAVYAIEATCHAPDKQGVYKEIYRVLKPGQCFACYEWCMTDKFDPENEEHKKIKHGIEIGDGIPDLATIKQTIIDLEAAGFEVVEQDDLAKEGDIKWYHPLEGQFTISNFRQTTIGRTFTHVFVNVMEFLRLAPKGTVKTHDVLIEAADNLVAGGRGETFTPMFFYLCRKPSSGSAKPPPSPRRESVL